MDLIGPRGQIDMGIGRYDTVLTALTKRRRRNHRSKVLLSIEQSLRNLVPSDDPYEVLWKGKNDVYKPKFITRDTWNHIRSTTSKVSWHKALWFNQATPKFRFCTWLALGNRLTTGDRMAAWNVGIDGSCVLCNQQLEIRGHLFFSCSYTSMV